MKISVSMATYNGEQFIGEQLSSLAAQTRLPDELVITDDCSTDRTLEIVKEFASRARFPVTVSRNPRNLGFRETFYRSAMATQGDWIAFCDQDDVWMPNKLEALDGVVQRSAPSLTLIAHSAAVVDERLTPSGITWPHFRSRTLRRGTRFPIWWNCPGFALAVRSDLLPAIREMSLDSLESHGLSRLEQSSHDIWATAVAQAVGDSILLPEPLVLYRRHTRSTSSVARVGGASREGIRKSYQLNFRIARAFSSDRQDTYELRARVAAVHADIFRRLSHTKDPPEWADKFIDAEERYRGFSKWMQRRSALRDPSKMARRALSFLILVMECGYFRFFGTSSLGAPVLIRELLVDFLAVFRPRNGSSP